jgi:imidazolonepropionase-like amidohydrolase
MADPRFASVAGSPREVPAAFDAIRAAGGIGVKVPIEKGFGPRELWPIHPAAMRDAISREAAERGLPIYVHASSEDEQQIGLEMGAHALVHLDFYAADPSPQFVERLVQQGTYVMTTFSIMDAELTRWHPERLDHPVVRLAVPETELATARDPEAGAAMALAQVASVFPRLPPFLRRVLAWLFVTEAGSRQRLESSQRAALELDRAGVPLVVGSDAGNSPEIPYQFHGTSTLRELELLAAAGLAPGEVLAAATRVPSRMLGLEREVGTIEAGKRADLLVLRDDPLADAAAFRTALYVVKDGIAHTPAEWRGDVP